MILLITAQDIQDSTNLSEFVDIKKIEKSIKFIQDSKIKVAIGEELLNALILAVKDLRDNGTPLTPEFDILLNGNDTFNGLVYAISWYAYSEYINWANYNDTQTGIRKYKDENSENASNEEMSALRKDIITKAEFYTREVVEFLKLNYIDYPLFKLKCNKNPNFFIGSVKKYQYPKRRY